MKKKKLWIILGIVLLLVIIGGVGIGVLLRDDNDGKTKSKKEKTNTINLDKLAFMQNYSVTDPMDDSDEDGILDGDEEKNGTNKFSWDTDNDGISDAYERDVSKTNPLLADTDNDGICDGDELSAGLDPNNKRSNGKDIDSERRFEREIALQGGTLEISGAANVYSLYADVDTEANLSMLPGIYGNVHEFVLEGQLFDEAILTLHYDKEEVEKKGLNPDKLQIYQVLDDLSLVPVESDNDGNGTVTASLPHFSNHALADKDVVESKETGKTKVTLLIDNSGSMFDFEGMAANDPEMKRLDMAKQLISMSNEKCEFQVSKFTATYTALTDAWSSDMKALGAAIDLITENENFDGTYIANSIIQATKNFDIEDTKTRKYIVILTDGETTESGRKCYSVTDAIQTAIDKNISVIAIGLGNDVDAEYLMQIADETGGFYVYANNAGALEQVAERINASINYNHVDKDGDGEFDTVIVADTGFSVEEDGFLFKNYLYIREGELIEGQCYGMAMLAQLYYTGRLPMSGGEIEGGVFGVVNKTQLFGTSYDFSDVPGYENEKGDVMSNTEPFISRFTFDEYVEYNNTKNKLVREDETSDKLVLKKEYHKLADENPFLEIYEYKYTSPVTWDDGKEVSVYERMCLTIDGVKEEELTDEQKQQYEMLRCIDHYFAYQGTNLVTIINPQTTKVSITESKLQEDEFNKLIKKLKEGVPLAISGKEHTITVIRLERSLENPLEYTLVLNDYNSPGEEKHITIKKKMRSGFYYHSATNWGNECRYYFYDDDGIFGEKGKEVDVIFEYVN